jgi:SAM-dependent methyltransferase
MTSKQRKKHWETVYASKAPEAVTWYQSHPAFSLDMIENTGVSGSSAVIDVGGGSSVLVDCLLDRGFSDITVLDLSAPALAHCQERLGDRSNRVKWLVEDITLYSPKRQYALWHDRAVFHFLTLAEHRQRYLEALKAGLAPGGHLVMATFALDGPEKCSGLPVERYDSNRLSETLGKAFSLLETRLESHRTPWGGEQRFAWFRFRRDEG